MNINDLKYAVINVTGLSINDEYFVWLGVNGGTGNTLPDREFSYLISQGGIPGSINDMWLDLLRASGYEGSLNDMLWDFWNNGGDFTLPIVNLQNMGLVHDAAGGDLVSGRSSTATFTDYEGRVVDVLANENRFDGANRIHNLVPSNNDLTDIDWSTELINNGLVGPTTLELTGINDSHYYLGVVTPFDNINKTFTLKVDLQRISGVDSVGLRMSVSGGSSVSKVIDLSDGNIKTISINFVADSNSLIYIGIDNRSYIIPGVNINPVKVLFTNIQLEDTTGQSNKSPNTIIDAKTIYNAGVPGVSYSAFESANTVDANGVVSEIQGALIFPAPTLLYEPQGINHCFPSDVPATQVITLAAADYTVWLDDTDGLGSIVLTGGATGTANSTDVNGFQFTASGAAITFTHSGSNNVRWQVEPGDHRTSYIPTTTVAVTRDVDDPNLPLVIDTNFVQEQGMAIFRYSPSNDKADIVAANLLLSVINTSSVLYDQDSNIMVSYDGTNFVTTPVSYVAGDDLIFMVIWNASENSFSVNYSNDGGVTYNAWGNGVYDGAYIAGTAIYLFLSHTKPNNLIACQIYGSLPGDTIADAKTWLEANARRVTQPELPAYNPLVGIPVFNRLTGDTDIVIRASMISSSASENNGMGDLIPQSGDTATFSQNGMDVGAGPGWKIPTLDIGLATILRDSGFTLSIDVDSDFLDPETVITGTNLYIAGSIGGYFRRSNSVLIDRFDYNNPINIQMYACNDDKPAQTNVTIVCSPTELTTYIDDLLCHTEARILNVVAQYQNWVIGGYSTLTTNTDGYNIKNAILLKRLQTFPASDIKVGLLGTSFFADAGPGAYFSDVDNTIPWYPGQGYASDGITEAGKSVSYILEQNARMDTGVICQIFRQLSKAELWTTDNSNRSQSGGTVQDAITQFDNMINVDLVSPDIVICNLGTNELALTTPISAAIFETDYKALLTDLNDANVSKVVIQEVLSLENAPTYADQVHRDAVDDYNVVINNLIAWTTSNTNITLVVDPIFSNFGGHTPDVSLFLTANHHPNVKGSSKLGVSAGLLAVALLKP